jgi:outer membrane murein-binding lipoprotein Lpp
VKVTSKIKRSRSAELHHDRSVTRAGCRGGRVSRSLIGGVALAALLAGTAAAKADDSDIAAQIKELKAQIRLLEKRVDAQQRTVSRVVIRQAQIPPGTVPYSPPQPWDKKFHLNGITITPGGFFAAEGVFRTRDQGADIGDLPFGSILPLSSPLAHMNELRFTARQSRISALVQGNYNPDVLISGYGELDFLGAGNTANSNESNSYNLRIRHMYATVDWQQEGFHILAGQTWSLATQQGKGITPRNEIIPLTIDAQYVAGFTWARQPGIRLTKNFGNEFWLAASAEMPQTAGIAGCPGLGGNSGASDATGTVALPSGVTALCNQTSGGGGLLNQVTTYSINHIPDVIAKGVWAPTIADRNMQFEGYGLYTDLYDRIYPGTAIGPVATNRDTAGWGVGGDALVPIMPKLVDLTGSALYGRGIGRYGSGGLNDATFNPDGSLDPLPELMFLGGATIHATPQLDLYINGGGEKILSSQYFPGFAGYGNPTLINNTGCGFEFTSTTLGCSAVTKDVWEVTAGLWDKIYQGAFGSVRVGLQYAYIKRDFEPGTCAGAITGGTGGTPAVCATQGPLLGGRTDENAVYASFRYYPFDPPPPAPPLVAKY